MPKLASHQSSSTTKLLLIGDTGGGKSGAVASLAAAGYNVRFLDMDNGIDVVKGMLEGPGTPYPAGSLERVDYVTITDSFKNVNGKLMPKKAEAWQKAVKLLDNWEDGEIKYGPISTWTSQDVLVIDSLTMLSNAALNFILTLNARLGQKPWQSDYGEAQDLVEHLLQMIYDDQVHCNVVVNTHIAYIETTKGMPPRGYPSCVGKALPQKVGRYFNSVLMAQGGKKIITQSTPLIDLKTTNPLRVKKEYPLGSGLADYFRDVRGSA